MRTQDSAGRGRRFHALRHADGMSYGGVPARPQADFARDDLAGVQPDAHLKFDAVATLHVGCQPLAAAWISSAAIHARLGVVLERHRGAEQSHQPVAGELVDGAQIALDDRGSD